MKRLSLMLLPVLTVFGLLVAAFAPSSPAQAQSGNGLSGDLIVLNDSTPGIDVVVNPSPDTTGVVALEISNASVMVYDAVGNLVFESSDTHIRGIEFSFAPNAGTHTVTVERLPGAVQAYARIGAQAEMTTYDSAPELVRSSTVAMAQEADFPLDSMSPSSAVNFVVPASVTAAVTARFPGAPVTAQLVDVAQTRSLATLSGSLIDGVRLTVDGGSYQLVMVNNNVAKETMANVSLLPARPSDFAVLVAEADASSTTTLASTSSSGVNSGAPVATCNVTVAVSSINLRSGPGTGYSVLDYAFRGESLPVGGTNSGGGWLLVGTDTGSGWMLSNLGMLSGTCDNLTVFDIPYREAATPQVTIQQPQVPVYRDDDDDYGYDDDDEYGEYDDDDWEEGEYDDD